MEVGNYLRNERGWKLSINRLKDVMGFKEWPDAGVPETLVGNTLVYVKPRNAPLGHGKSGMRHRATAICPDCGKHVPTGRLNQHLKVHKPA
jgi:hypothetical protein